MFLLLLSPRPARLYVPVVLSLNIYLLLSNLFNGLLRACPVAILSGANMSGGNLMSNS